MLERTLGASGYEVRTVADGGVALAALEQSVPDLLVLDVAMAGIDGLAVAQRVRSKGLALPILFVTARDAVPDRVAGFQAGGDDYLVKPFATEELLARVGALLRRTRPLDRELAHRDLRLDPGARRATRSGREIVLTARESALLELLLCEAGRTVTRDHALREIWGDTNALASVVDRYIAYLRRKLGDPPLIETVRGVGFRISR